MVVIPQMDAQAGEAIWRLLAGAAQDSWEAICKHSHPSHSTHTSTPELRPRRGGGGGGGGGGDNSNSERADSGRGSGSGSGSGGNNNNNNNDNSNNRGSTGKTTTADHDTTTAAAADPTTTAAAAKTTSTIAAAAAPTSTTPAAAATTTAAAETAAASTAAAANTEAADTTTEQAAAAATTTADAAAQTTADDTAAAAAATETAAAAAATSAAQAATAATQAAGDTATATAAAVAAATQTAGGSETTYANTNGQTTTRHIAATTTAATGTLGAAAATGTSTSTASGSAAESTSSSNTGLIAGVVVGAILFLILAFAAYWFRHSKYFKALCCCFGLGGAASNKNDGNNGTDSNDNQTRTRHMADSNARLVSHASAGSLLTPMSSAVPAAAVPARDEKRGYNDMSEKMNSYGIDAKSRDVGREDSRPVFHDEEKREMAARDLKLNRDLNLRPPPPVSMHNSPHSPTSPLTPTSAVSTSSTSSVVSSASASAHKPAHRQRSPSYSTFPLTTRSHNYSNSITRAQAGAGALPTPPPTAVQKDRQASQSSQGSQPQYHQKKNSVPRVAVQVAELPADPPAQATGFPFKEQPARRMSRTAPSPLALSTSPEGLAPPPRNSTSRQRQSTVSHDAPTLVLEKDDDTASLAPTFNRSSYTDSIGGESISSSVLMSPALLQWPVPPNTPPVSQFSSEAGGALSASNSNSNLSAASGSTLPAGRSKSQESIESGSTDTNSQGSGPLFDRVAIVPSHVPTVVSAANLPVPRRPLTTVSSISSNTLGQNGPVPPMPNRGSMPTRASLGGPSSRSLMQMQSARRPSVASSGGSSSIGQAVPGPPPTRPPYPPYAYSQGSQSPRSPHSPRGPPSVPGSPHGMPIYQQQQYPHPQRLPPTGYIPPQASAVTVHHTGQATSVRVPIARNPAQQRY